MIVGSSAVIGIVGGDTGVQSLDGALERPPKSRYPPPDHVELQAVIPGWDRPKLRHVARRWLGDDRTQIEAFDVGHARVAPALAVPDDAALEDLITLLCWHVRAGEQLAGTSEAERIRRAAELDPDDSLMLREMPTVLRYVDDLVEASCGPADALIRVENGRITRAQAAGEPTPGAFLLEPAAELATASRAIAAASCLSPSGRHYGYRHSSAAWPVARGALAASGPMGGSGWRERSGPMGG
ncbi:hypothetical protein F0Q45_15810 [Mycobacterium simiae]|uniref:Uncharacterized protein n=1 Tax=Mycobacterium simiae TaxID=1784 RepID=A0A5B1BQ16_MYCSI|nr:hypothetical protein [Mycobacterium simiae]KAA1249304.1 hypothetical protein F0Q45_15810 [Mycobacterium simiae]